MNYKCLLSSTVLALALTPFTFAGTVFNNGAPGGEAGGEMTFTIQASDFTITGDPVTLTAVRFWAVTGPVGSDGFAGEVAWFIYGDAPGPGALLFSGLATPTVAERTTVFNELTSYQYDFGINAGPLSAGTYWLGLHNGDLGVVETAASFYWEASGTGNGKEQFNAGFGDALGDAPWNNNGLEHAFMLFDVTTRADVPEPSTVVLMSAGMAALALRRMRRV